MPPMPSLMTTGQLYPPRNTPEFWTWICAMTTGDLDDKGNFVLRGSLTLSDRDVLQARATQLAPFLVAGHHTKIAGIVNQMLLGFGGKVGDEAEAAVTATQFAKMLAGVPLWAVQRACDRFGGGEVRAEELGAKHFDISYPPSTAQLRKIAVDLVRPFGEESTRIWMTLRGTPARVETPEQRAVTAARIAESLKDYKVQVEEGKLVEAEAEARATEARNLERLRSREDEIRAEYAAKGLTPPKGQLVSLALMLSMGWTIVEAGGRRILVEPPRREHQPDPEQRTAPEQKTTARGIGDLARGVTERQA